MCGRYTYYPGEFHDLKIFINLDRDIPTFKPRYNIAPSQQAPVIANLDGENRIEMFQWGLVPSWAKDPTIGNRMINARAETLAEKPSFKRLLGKRRCLVLADGFYEWRKEGKGKVPMRFKLKSDKPFVFAGLWDTWKQPGGEVLSTYTIVTTEPNELLARIHNRMPVMLKDDDALKWLNVDAEMKHALSLLKPYPAELMDGYDVSKLVNNPRNDSPDCVTPATA
jgi:putative SOS response-associated peptidase YedK